MVDTHLSVPAKLFGIPEREASLYSRESPDFIYFWDPNDKKGSVIVDKSNGSYLSANNKVTYNVLLEAYNKGYRS